MIGNEMFHISRYVPFICIHKSKVILEKGDIYSTRVINLSAIIFE